MASSLRAWFTGESAVQASASQQPTNEEKLHTMRTKRETLERRHDAVRAKVVAALTDAQRFGQAGQMELARDALRRKQVHERELKQVADLLRTMNQQLSAIETASLSASVATSMRDGASVMTNVHADLDVAGIERDMVEMRLKARETEHVTRLMTRPLFDTDGIDDADFDPDEQARLDRELATLMDSPPVDGGGSVAVSPLVVVDALRPQQSKSVRELEKELGL